MRNGAIATKHVFVGSTRLASKLSPGTAHVEPDNNGGVTLTPDNGSGNFTGNPNQQAQNALRNPHFNSRFDGNHPGRGRVNRSEQGREHAQDVNKNPHLVGTEPPPPPPPPPGNGNPGNGNGNPPAPMPEGNFLYYYHPDHLGSSSYVTDADGELYEHVQYFPFGETWVDQRTEIQRVPYLFTGKELDEETGLYYFGARYYDPRTSVWQSPDPILDSYLNGRASGGVFAPANLGLYSYAHQRPIVARDPDGNFVLLTLAVVGAAWTAYDTYQTYQEAGGGEAGLKAAGQALATDAAIGLVTGGAGKLALKVVPDSVKRAVVDKVQDGVGQIIDRVKGADAVDDVAEGIVYKRTNPRTGECYVGQCRSQSRYEARQREHDRNLDAEHEYEVLGRAEPGANLDVLEETKIRESGGLQREGGSLVNKRHQMSEDRYRAAGGTADDPTR